MAQAISWSSKSKMKMAENRPSLTIIIPMFNVSIFVLFIATFHFTITTSTEVLPTSVFLQSAQPYA
jgi:hypothetical protein